MIPDGNALDARILGEVQRHQTAVVATVVARHDVRENGSMEGE